MILKHFHYMLIPIRVHYSETTGVQPPIFGYVFCFGEIKKTSHWKPKSAISVNRLFLWPKMYTKSVWEHFMKKSMLPNEIIYTNDDPEVCNIEFFFRLPATPPSVTKTGTVKAWFLPMAPTSAIVVRLKLTQNIGWHMAMTRTITEGIFTTD